MKTESGEMMQRCRESHTGKEAPGNKASFSERIPVQREEDEAKQLRFKLG